MRILIAEDEAVSRRLLESFLTGLGYDVIVTKDGGEAWAELAKPDAPFLVISDWMMPSLDGLELCRRIRSRPDSGYIYFIIVTAKGGKEDLVKGLEAGADDYLAKPFDREELKCRVKIGERIISLERRILKLANRDHLTGLLNRRAFMERMHGEIQRAKREQGHLSFLIMDIDHFKLVNDRYGHQVGDLALHRVGDILSTSLRPYDYVGRYGGEEFVACIPGVQSNGAHGIAERLRFKIEEMAIPLPDGKGTFGISASFGVSSMRLEFGDDEDTIIRRADDALYRAKSEGRNRVCMSGEERQNEKQKKSKPRKKSGRMPGGIIDGNVASKTTLDGGNFLKI